MNRDPLGDQEQQLFSAARREAPSDEARARTLAALKQQGSTPRVAELGFSRRIRPLVITVGVAAAALLTFGLSKDAARSPSISAEPVAKSPGMESEAEALPKEAGPDAPPSTDDALAPQETPIGMADRQANDRIATTRPTALPPKRVPPTLEEELSTIQDARSKLGAGDENGALSVLESFGRGPGWHQLSAEASLLRIESLAKAGRTTEASAEAARFVERHPNNPLVDRAREYTTEQSGSEEPAKEEGK